MITFGYAIGTGSNPINQRVIAQLAKDYVTQEAEKYCDRHLPSLATLHSFPQCIRTGGFSYTPRD